MDLDAIDAPELIRRIREQDAEIERLREAATAVLSRLDYLQGLWGAEGVTTRLADGLRAALDSKGGET